MHNLARKGTMLIYTNDVVDRGAPNDVSLNGPNMFLILQVIGSLIRRGPVNPISWAAWTEHRAQGI